MLTNEDRACVFHKVYGTGQLPVCQPHKSHGRALGRYRIFDVLSRTISMDMSSAPHTNLYAAVDGWKVLHITDSVSYGSAPDYNRPVGYSAPDRHRRSPSALTPILARAYFNLSATVGGLAESGLWHHLRKRKYDEKGTVILLISAIHGLECTDS